MNAGVKLGFLAQGVSTLLLHGALLIPPSTITHTQLALAFLPLIWSCHYYAWECGLGYLAGVHALWATELLFRQPRERFQLIHQKKPASSPWFPKGKTNNSTSDEDKQHDFIWKEPYPTMFWKRFWWVLKLEVSMRYVGWDIGDGRAVKKVSWSNNSRRSRWARLLKDAVFAGMYCVLIDATNFYQYFDPYFQIETDIDEKFPRRLAGFFTRYYMGFLPARFVRISVLGVQQYCMFAIMHSAAAIIFVALGEMGILDDFWGCKESWPPLLGNPLVVITEGLRGLWGKVWHQLFRVILTGPGKTLIRVLRVPSRSLLAYGIQVFFAFVISGFVHVSTIPQNIEYISARRYASFFFIQGACVIVEVIAEHAIQFAWVGGTKPVWAKAGGVALRLVWTMGVLYYTVPIIEDELVRVSRLFGLKPVHLFRFPRS